MSFLRMEQSGQRANTFTHPSTDFIHKRWKLVFNVPNPLWDDEEECEFLDAEYYCTSFHDKVMLRSVRNGPLGFTLEDYQDSVPDELALANMKLNLKIVAIVYLEQCQKDYPDRTPNLKNIYTDERDWSNDEVSRFIRLFNPLVKIFGLGDLDALDHYKYLLYSTGKLINELRCGNIEDLIAFKTDDEFFEWVDSHGLN